MLNGLTQKWIALFIVLFVTGAILSRNWQQSPERQPQAANQPANDESRGTEASPLIVEIPHSEASDTHPGYDKTKAGIESSAELAAARYTGYLVLVGIIQLGLFWWQLRLIRKSLADSKEAADAAKLNAEAVINAERPHIIVSDIDMRNFRPQGLTQFDQSRWPIARFNITNHGKSPAWLVGIAFCLRGYERGLPGTPEYSPLETLLGAPFPLTTQRCIRDIDRNYELGELVASEWEAIVRERKFLFFFGYVEYTDIFRKEITHRSSFAFRFQVGKGIVEERFLPCGPDIYWEYT